jgi:hypothetical protein
MAFRIPHFINRAITKINYNAPTTRPGVASAGSISVNALDCARGIHKKLGIDKS